MKIETPTLILVGLVIVCMTALVALSKITGTVYVGALVGTIIPAMFPALVKKAAPELPSSERPTDPEGVPAVKS